ncbi:MAG: hypothetical protein LPK58_00475 [Gammaproteobacteria bacterium]|nr:hypothetical protein [Gammaproteobacteria bacterium]MDX5374246.1 hypothetical protein [Gammaproteobacteria bacterium]
MYELKQIDAKTLEGTVARWNAQLAELADKIPSSRYTRILDWARRFVDGDGDPNTYVYALCPCGASCEAHALLEISHALPNTDAAWLKVLQIHIEPRLDVSKEETIGHAAMRELARVASFALTEALGLTFDAHPSSSLKVYGATPLTLDFLEGIAAMLPDENGMNVAKKGNWLVIEKPI